MAIFSSIPQHLVVTWDQIFLGAVGLFASVSFASALYAARAWPIGVRRRLDAMERVVLDAQAAVERLDGAWKKRQVELAEFEEAMTGLAEQIETKRRRIAARESRANGGAAPPEVPPLGSPERRIWLERMAAGRG